MRAAWLVLLAGCQSAILAPADLAAPADLGVPIDLASVDLFEGWRTLQPLPMARQETAVAVLGGLIYVVGGFDAAQNMVATVEAYDAAADTWLPRAPLPTAMHHANLAVLDGKLWVVGGLGAGFAAIGLMYSYDPAMNQWTPRGTMPAGSERGSAMTAAMNGRVYLAGGSRSSSSREFSSYEIANGMWRTHAMLPAALDHGAAVIIDGRFHFFGGRVGGTANQYGHAYRWDEANDRWIPLASMPAPRSGFAAALVGGRVIAAGGEGNTRAASGVFDQVEAYDPVNDSWSPMPPMKTPRHGTGGAELNGVFYVPGGATLQGFGAVATMEAIRP